MHLLLVVSVWLTQLACMRAVEMHDLWSHRRPDGSWWYTILPSSTPPGTYYEIAARASSFEEALELWYHSPPHWKVVSIDADAVGVCEIEGLVVVITQELWEPVEVLSIDTR